jgi:F-type H+-transporting ATPase subunit c
MDALGNYLAILAFAAGMGLPIAVLGAALGQGKAGAAALEGIARQPEAAGRIQTAMIIALALIESLAIYALLVSLILLFQIGLPKGDDVLRAITSQQPAATAPAR